MILHDYLNLMVQQGASDLYLSTYAIPSVKIEGRLHSIGNAILAPGSVKKLAYSALTPQQITDFETNHELNLALSYQNSGRFRINVFLQRGEVAMVVRNIKTFIPSIESLGLPPVLGNLAMEKRGLILIVGATSSGKSTTLAAMLDYRNTHSAGHIITIEDPIEYVHPHKTSIVNQREVGIDTLSYGEALKNTLRQSPDVIMIGEIRAEDTMQYAITFAETGHLCLSTLHASNVEQALDRIIHFFPSARRDQLLLDLSLNLVALISQRLVPSLDNMRVPAVEVMVATPLIRDLIRRGEIGGLREIMDRSNELGMQTFDSALYQLYRDKKISEQEALTYADSQNNLRLRMKLEKGVDGAASGLSLQNSQQAENGGLPKPGEFIRDKE